MLHVTFFFEIESKVNWRKGWASRQVFPPSPITSKKANGSKSPSQTQFPSFSI